MGAYRFKKSIRLPLVVKSSENHLNIFESLMVSSDRLFLVSSERNSSVASVNCRSNFEGVYASFNNLGQDFEAQTMAKWILGSFIFLKISCSIWFKDMSCLPIDMNS